MHVRVWTGSAEPFVLVGFETKMKLTQQQLEAHLMGAANILRGRTAARSRRSCSDCLSEERFIERIWVTVSVH